MTDKEAREYGGKILAKARDYGELAGFVRHALTAIADRVLLVEAEHSGWEEVYARTINAAMNHMRGEG
jgi:hypothetical protein